MSIRQCPVRREVRLLTAGVIRLPREGSAGLEGSADPSLFRAAGTGGVR